MPGAGSAREAWLVGRTAELTALGGALETHALVTLTGLPGVGRSAIASVAGQRLRAAGVPVVTVALAAVDNGLAAVDAVLAELPGEGLSTSLPEALWEVHDGARVVLVLEDVDRVEGLGEQVSALVGGYPAATVLCTALRSTRIPGECVVRVDALPLPDDDAGVDHPALQLFATHAARGGADLDLADPVVRADVARICRDAGGLPGVIALSAARVGALGLSVVAHALTGRAGVDVALGWTHDLLSKSARQTLEQLSVFVGPFQLDAVAAVVERGPTSGDPADDLLELVDAHLVELGPHQEDARFVLPEPVRRFAARRLASTDEASAVRDRHARYFRSRGLAGADVVRREWPDIAAALDHGLDTGQLDDTLATAIALAPEVQEVPGARASLEERISELLAREEHVPDRLRAQALMWSASAYPHGASADVQRVGMWTAQRLAEAAALARESGDGPALLAVLDRTVRSLRITLDLASAVAAAHEGLALAARLDDQRALSRFEVWVAMATLMSGDAQGAARLATAAVVRGREQDDPISTTAGTHLLLTLPPELRPDLDPPLPSLEDLLEECQRRDQPFTAMTVLGTLAQESHARGADPEAARWLWRLLMIAANRQRTEPMATLGAVAMLLTAALALHEDEDAARLREYTRPLELFVRYCLGPAAMVDYERDTGRLDALVPEERRAEIAAEVAALGLDGVNRWAQRVARRLSGHRPPESSVDVVTPVGLTPRETEVLAELASGSTNREIAETLGMSAKTVMHHSVAIYRKLGVRGRAGATAWAVQQGVTRSG